jgi:hypothetical protein
MARTRDRVTIGVLALLVCVASASSTAWPYARILFPRNTPVPPSVQAFAWQVIETHCNDLGYERAQRSFWAYETRATTVSAETVYSIRILSELPWRKTEPPATIDMAVALQDGQMRVAALTSTFVVCE